MRCAPTRPHAPHASPPTAFQSPRPEPRPAHHQEAATSREREGERARQVSMCSAARCGAAAPTQAAGRGPLATPPQRSQRPSCRPPGRCPGCGLQPQQAHRAHAREDLVQPLGALLAGRALPAALVLVKGAQARNGVHQVRRLVLRASRRAPEEAPWSMARRITRLLSTCRAVLAHAGACACAGAHSSSAFASALLRRTCPHASPGPQPGPRNEPRSPAQLPHLIAAHPPSRPPHHDGNGGRAQRAALRLERVKVHQHRVAHLHARTRAAV